MFETQFCKVHYLSDKNAVLCSWKKYCSLDDYREPLKFGLKLINDKVATTWITDTRDGFESTQEDKQWLATEFSPQAIHSSCKNIVFIIQNDSPLKSEIELHAQLLGEFFRVRLVEQIEEI